MFGTRTFEISVLARKVRPTGVGREATWNGGSGSASRLIQPGGRREINKGKKEPLRGGRAGVGEEGGNNLGDTCAVGSLPGSLQQGKEERTSMSRWERGQGAYLRQRNMYGNIKSSAKTIEVEVRREMTTDAGRGRTVGFLVQQAAEIWGLIMSSVDII